jgi:HD-like signal output (HDOD) protein
MKASVLETIKKSAAVPSMPQVVMRFLEIMQDPNFEYRDLAKVLSADAGTVSEVLRLANSALFGVRNKVVSLQHALTLLGPKRVRSLLLGRYLVDSISGKHVTGLDMSYFWRRSLTGSVISSHFAAAVLPKSRDESSIAALLADIGIPILAETFPKDYAPFLKQYHPHGAVIDGDKEIEAVDVSHGQVSAMILAHWRLPEDISNAVNLHQSTHPGEGNVATMARILYAADRIAKLLCEVPKPETIIPNCAEATAFVGVDLPLLLNMLPTIETDIEELADALRIDVLPSSVYAIVAKTVQEQLEVGTTG